ncbi:MULTISPECIES: (Fe-S)-binding protein [unclassified Gilvimarinus]|uniref:(Fe-S)-binding protein n=1 Tax=unclassified Gilvimarinus TaxID=2642066 RepID=UPI0026E47743|nr:MULTISPECIES: (Fe-S)-binding protein [unclassified Gilvimarinus]MDO6570497.1 (Fe-S)-binding protein [Gilvimarinus sp. 2_MG-2023]MDO6748599.1 (Fe-S)-binding protein [Gilvimarinus sp. 1_MG-2023]
MTETTSSIQVALYVTCLVDVMRPSVGFAAIKLLQNAGCDVIVPKQQTCCGQPGYNSGDEVAAKALAQQVIETFESYDYVVAPSGSCAGMIKDHYPKLFSKDAEWHSRALALAKNTHELTSFLVDELGVQTLDAHFEGSVCYHDSCAGLRELNVKAQPRQLLSSVKGLSLQEMKGEEECCGFGGLFCVKYSDISNTMVSRKLDNIERSGADTLLAGDLGCLLNMAGKMTREGSTVKARHVAEVLAGMTDLPAIGEGEG